jgi:hypothetical protein
MRQMGSSCPVWGPFDPAMRHLGDRNLIEPIREIIASGKPFLGICLGLQVLFESSEEGVEPGLGVLKGTIKHFQPEPGLTIPHMGWNQLQITNPPTTPLAPASVRRLGVFCAFLLRGSRRSQCDGGNGDPRESAGHCCDRKR